MLKLKEFVNNVISILYSIWMIGMQVFSKRETRMYPDSNYVPFPRYRGRIVLTKDSLGHERCVACNLCAVSCPVGCISLKKKESVSSGRWYPEFFKINFARCIFCGMCEEACPTAAIQLTSDFEMSDYKKDTLVYDKSNLLISGPGKYLKYDFYRFSGVKIFGKDKGDAKHEVHPINVKNILP